MKAHIIYVHKGPKHCMSEVNEFKAYLEEEIEKAVKMGNTKRVLKLSNKMYELGKNRRVEWPVE